MAKKEHHSGIEIIESAEVLQDELNKAEGFMKKNQSLITIAAVGLLVLVAGIVGYNYWNKSKDADAQAAMVDATFAFESDSLKAALNGVGGSDGFLKIAEEYGSTKSGNLAHLYAGIALLKEGKFDNAIEQLKGFSSDDLILQGRAYALIGDAYTEKKNNDEAINYYKKAAEYKANKFMTPGYLMKLGLAYETANRNAEAIDTYTKLIEEYGASPEIVNARKYRARLQAMGK